MPTLICACALPTDSTTAASVMIQPLFLNMIFSLRLLFS
jgi:hypothetical protein